MNADAPASPTTSPPVGNSKPRRGKAWLVRAAKLLMLALVVWFVWGTLKQAWTQLFDNPDPAKRLAWQFHGGWLAAAGVIYATALLPAGLFWWRALRALGQDARLAETLRAYFIGHLGKYVPGKAMVVVLRAGLIGGHRVHVGIAAASVFLETLTWIAVGSFLAAALLAVPEQGHPTFLFGALGLLVVAALPTLPPVFARLAKAARVGRGDPEVAAQLHNLRMTTLLAGWGMMAVSWTLMGICYWATLRGMGVDLGSPWEHLPRLVASVALATVLGFVALVLPAGMGVREAALMALMAPYLRAIPEFTANAEAIAVVSAVALRLVSLVSEVSVSGILYVLGIRWDRPAPGGSSAAEDASP